MRVRLYLFASRFLRGLTGGVRVLAVEADRVLLVRHTYVAGWHLPGGGVEPGETFEAAARRELEEEASVSGGTLCLVSLHLNRVSMRDHVALYRCEGFTRGAFEPDHEIAEIGMFAVDALPEGTTDATRRRIAEVREGKEPDAYW